MELSDADALRRLYRFTIDVKASPKLVSSMEAHIAVSCVIIDLIELTTRNA
jgi:hypothetical protein